MNELDNPKVKTNWSLPSSYLFYSQMAKKFIGFIRINIIPVSYWLGPGTVRGEGVGRKTYYIFQYASLYSLM